MKILITGTAGFIGFHLAKLLLDSGFEVLGYDGMTDYYDVNLKQERHKILLKNSNFKAIKGMLEDHDKFNSIANEFHPDIIVHLAAQAGVRYSLENPRSYINSNIIGTFNVMEAAKKLKVKHLLVASTSSVYGANTKMPFTEIQKADTQLTIYAATKKAVENMAHSYAYLCKIPTTMFRFFTVYGPWGRPDMAMVKFVTNIIKKKKIDVFNKGNHHRDFTYIDDIVDGIVKACFKKRKHNYRIYNLGNGKKIALTKLINTIQSKLGLKAKINLKKMQKGDVKNTLSDLSRSKKELNYNPRVKIEEGIDRYIKWYRKYYNI